MHRYCRANLLFLPKPLKTVVCVVQSKKRLFDVDHVCKDRVRSPQRTILRGAQLASGMEPEIAAGGNCSVS
jgi:hypothetical protein